MGSRKVFRCKNWFRRCCGSIYSAAMRVRKPPTVLLLIIADAISAASAPSVGALVTSFQKSSPRSLFPILSPCSDSSSCYAGRFDRRGEPWPHRDFSSCILLAAVIYLYLSSGSRVLICLFLQMPLPCTCFTCSSLSTVLLNPHALPLFQPLLQCLLMPPPGSYCTVSCW